MADEIEAIIRQKAGIGVGGPEGEAPEVPAAISEEEILAEE